MRRFVTHLVTNNTVGVGPIREKVPRMNAHTQKAWDKFRIEMGCVDDEYIPITLRHAFALVWRARGEADKAAVAHSIGGVPRVNFQYEIRANNAITALDEPFKE